MLASNKSNAKADSFLWPRLLEAGAKLLWPIVALAVLFMVGIGRIRQIAANLVRVKAGQLEVEFGPDRARQVQRDFSGSVETFESTVRSEYDRQSKRYQIHDVYLSSAVHEFERLLGRPLPLSFRATVHVPDVVFDDYLYQLVDYYPVGSGRGRRFSQRYGMIGRSWRLNESFGDGNAPLLVNEQSKQGRQNAIEHLIQEWGMTREEAEGPRWSKRSILCVLLLDDSNVVKVPVGILYMDAEQANALTPDENTDAIAFAKSLEDNPSIKALARVVALVMAALRTGATNLDIERKS